MRHTSTILLLLLSKIVLAQTNPLSEADQLFAQRDEARNLTKAISLLNEYTARGGSKDYEAFWRLARFYYYVGDSQTVKKDKTETFQQGVQAAEKAIAINKERIEGHFWLASNSGGLAEVAGVFKSLGLTKTIRREFETAYKIDSGFDNGSVYQALGELYIQLPGLLGGDRGRGMKFLEEGVRLFPSNVDLSLTLAHYYIQKHQKAEARKLLEAALTAGDPLRSAVELEHLRSRARSMLAKL
jgi:tetratricopeptide (TPR) repeat protein